MRRVTPGIRSVSPRSARISPHSQNGSTPTQAPVASQETTANAVGVTRNAARMLRIHSPSASAVTPPGDPERVTRVVAHEARAVRREPADETAGHPRPAPGHGCRRPRRQPQQRLGVGLSGGRRRHHSPGPGLAGGPHRDRAAAPRS